MKTMKNCHNLDLKCGVLLLAALFEKFRNYSFKNYELCTSLFLSAPALNLDAVLNMAKVELELFPDPNISIFFEKGMKGAVSYICNKYSNANN